MILFLRALVVILITLGCGVKGAPRPAQSALKAPVTVPGAQPVQKEAP